MRQKYVYMRASIFFSVCHSLFKFTEVVPYWMVSNRISYCMLYPANCVSIEIPSFEKRILSSCNAKTLNLMRFFQTALWHSCTANPYKCARKAISADCQPKLCYSGKKGPCSQTHSHQRALARQHTVIDS